MRDKGQLTIVVPQIAVYSVCAPKGQKHISPGQDNASIASFVVALGTGINGFKALKGRHNRGRFFVSPLEGNREMGILTQGGACG